MECPRDGAQLAAERYEAGVEVDRCADCGGVWLDAGELERAQETIEKEHDAGELSRIESVAAAWELARQRSRGQISCPKCGRGLEAREYAYCSRILVDRCPGCRGVWLDAGELEALERFFEQERALEPGFWASLFARLG